MVQTYLWKLQIFILHRNNTFRFNWTSNPRPPTANQRSTLSTFWKSILNKSMTSSVVTLWTTTTTLKTLSNPLTFVSCENVLVSRIVFVIGQEFIRIIGQNGSTEPSRVSSSMRKIGIVLFCYKLFNFINSTQLILQWFRWFNVKTIKLDIKILESIKIIVGVKISRKK